jgi:hypothetical protein
MKLAFSAGMSDNAVVAAIDIAAVRIDSRPVTDQWPTFNWLAELKVVLRVVLLVPIDQMALALSPPVPFPLTVPLLPYLVHI